LKNLEIPPNTNNEIRWELPASGVGYETYNRNDTQKNYNYSLNPANPKQRPRMPDQIGTRNTIERIQTLAREWHAQHPDRSLQVGDISLPGGVNTPDHGTHENGRNVDVRPLRNDGNSGDAARLTYNSPAYDRELTKEFIKLTVAQNPGTTFYFNDPKIYNDPEFTGIVTSSDRSYDNHLHIMFPENR
jgi:conjugal transfer mating pair stabilization protein TraG